MRWNVTMGPPIDLDLYAADELHLTRLRRFDAADPDLRAIHMQREQSRRKAVHDLPDVRFPERES